MKRNSITFVMILAFFIQAYSQKLAESKVPVVTKKSFNQKFPGIMGKWEKENGNYEVNFTKEGKLMSAVIDAGGSILETETDIPVNQLPAGIEAYIKNHYKGAVIKEAAQIVKANGETVYEAEVNKKDILFDTNGKFIKEVKD